MPQVIVNSLSEYVQTICSLNGSLVRDGAINHEILLFRGQSDSNYALIPALGRNREYTCDISILNEERNLIELAKFKLPDVFRAELQPIELLALLQHHGIPTRLLDVTESALVALYFACCSRSDREGEVIAFKNNERDVANYPVINAIADSYRLAIGTFYPLSLFYGAAKDQPYFLEQKLSNEICYKTDEEGGGWIKECCKHIQFVYAPIRSLRQQIQRGRYILFPNSIEHISDDGEDSFVTRMDAIPKDHEAVACRIMIPKEIKEKLLSELSVMGISKSILFADNIDTVCEGIVQDCQYRVTGNTRKHGS